MLKDTKTLSDKQKKKTLSWLQDNVFRIVFQWPRRIFRRRCLRWLWTETNSVHYANTDIANICHKAIFSKSPGSVTFTWQVDLSQKAVWVSIIPYAVRVRVWGPSTKKRKPSVVQITSFSVRMVRLELTQANAHYPLKVACLPFHHIRRWSRFSLHWDCKDTHWFWNCKLFCKKINWLSAIRTGHSIHIPHCRHSRSSLESFHSSLCELRSISIGIQTILPAYPELPDIVYLWEI